LLCLSKKQINQWWMQVFLMSQETSRTFLGNRPWQCNHDHGWM
jgi:hypothetical protein